jgi:hypothetical protein
MRLSELKVGVEYAILPNYEEVRGRYADINTIANARVIKATITSMDVYDYDSGKRGTDPSAFTIAVPQSKKSGRALVMKTEDIYNPSESVYLTVQLKQILIEWSVLVPIWDEQKRLQKEREAKEETERKVLEAKRVRAREHAERSRHSLPKTVKSLVGARCGDVSVDYNAYSSNPDATITMRLTDFEILLEQLYDKKEEVA